MPHTIPAFSAVSINIKAAPATVWSLVRDADKAILTNPLLVSATLVEGSRTGVGERQRHVAEVGGRRHEFEFEIIEDVPERRTVARSGDLGLQTFDLEYSHVLGTTVTLTRQGPVDLRRSGLARPSAILERESLAYLTMLRRVAESGAVDGDARAATSGPHPPPAVIAASGRSWEWWRRIATRLLAHFLGVAILFGALMGGMTWLGKSGHSIGSGDMRLISALAVVMAGLFAPVLVHSAHSLRFGNPAVPRLRNAPTPAPDRGDAGSIGRHDSWS